MDRFTDKKKKNQNAGHFTDWPAGPNQECLIRDLLSNVFVSPKF